jgi:hypothetical protein
MSTAAVRVVASVALTASLRNYRRACVFSCKRDAAIGTGMVTVSLPMPRWTLTPPLASRCTIPCQRHGLAARSRHDDFLAKMLGAVEGSTSSRRSSQSCKSRSKTIWQRPARRALSLPSMIFSRIVQAATPQSLAASWMFRARGGVLIPTVGGETNGVSIESAGDAFFVGTGNSSVLEVLPVRGGLR